VKVLEQPGEQLWVLMPNLHQPPWDSLEARRALLAALDRNDMMKDFAPAPTQVAHGWKPMKRPPTFPAPSLESLGLTGQKVKLHLAPQKGKGQPHELLAARIVEDLGKAGLTVELEEHAELVQLAQSGEFEGLVLMGRDTSDPIRFLNVPWDGGHFQTDRPDGAHFDAPMVEAWDRYVTSLYDERRGHLEDLLQRLWLERLPMLPLVLTSRLAAIRSDLVGPNWGEADSLWWNVGDWRRTP
jgi:ABC-type oligopeptide transport system substrate-binding subunit